MKTRVILTAAAVTGLIGFFERRQEEFNAAADTMELHIENAPEDTPAEFLAASTATHSDAVNEVAALEELVNELKASLTDAGGDPEQAAEAASTTATPGGEDVGASSPAAGVDAGSESGATLTA